MRLILMSSLALALAVPAGATNLVTNGDFSAGNTGFTSSYNYIAPGGGPFSLYPENAYTVDTNASNVHNLWANIPGQGGGGKYLIVNGATNPNSLVWKSGSIAVTPNTNYRFDAYETNICCGSRIGSGSLTTFSVDGNLTDATLEMFMTNDVAVGTWQKLANVWNSGLNTSVTLSLHDANAEFDGNDFGVDSINFAAVPEPASWAMLIAGFGMVGIVARRRKAAVAA